jgi:hypothetical protein
MLVTAGIYAGVTHQLSIPLVVATAAAGAIAATRRDTLTLPTSRNRKALCPKR